MIIDTFTTIFSRIDFFIITGCALCASFSSGVPVIVSIHYTFNAFLRNIEDIIIDTFTTIFSSIDLLIIRGFALCAISRNFGETFFALTAILSFIQFKIVRIAINAFAIRQIFLIFRRRAINAFWFTILTITLFAFAI
jgi:hypothetical protein